jgi:hypothetical protein
MLRAFLQRIVWRKMDRMMTQLWIVNLRESQSVALEIRVLSASITRNKTVGYRSHCTLAL